MEMKGKSCLVLERIRLVTCHKDPFPFHFLPHGRGLDSCNTLGFEGAWFGVHGFESPRSWFGWQC